MIIEGISVRYKRKFDLGQYNSVECEEMVYGKLEEGESLYDAQQRLWREVKASVMAQALPAVRPRQEKIQAAFDSLPTEIKEEILANRI